METLARRFLWVIMALPVISLLSACAVFDFRSSACDLCFEIDEQRRPPPTARTPA